VFGQATSRSQNQVEGDHHARRYHVDVKATTLLLLFCTPVLADLAAGAKALENGDYARALIEFLPLAKHSFAN
jgi:hypothetical protein